MLSIRKACMVILLNLVFLILFLALIEGLASIVMLSERALFKDLIAERVHTRYDEEIGWINIPNLSITDMYGEKTFITNSMSFRNDKEFSPHVPDKKVRLLCSGDSFTMGYGVGNDEAWCAKLEDIDERIEAANLGHGGYGVDQSYLWYKRNSSRLEHDIHIFAFIAGDFTRMQRKKFVGYGKPFLTLQGDELVNTNNPVPKRHYLAPRLPVIIRELSQLRAIGIFQRKSLQKDPSLVLDEQNKKDEHTKKVVPKIIEDLQNISKTANSTLVFVLLPIQDDYIGKKSEKWRRFFHRQAAKYDVIFIDLIDDFRKYPPQEVGSLFNGHYSVKGNEYIAKILYENLLSIPEIASRFQDT